MRFFNIKYVTPGNLTPRKFLASRHVYGPTFWGLGREADRIEAGVASLGNKPAQAVIVSILEVL